VRQAYQQHRLVTSKELIDKLRELSVMEHLFGERTHYQLVHRSQDLIKLLFNEREIRETEIDMIWSVGEKQGHQIKLEIYKIVLEVLRAAYSCMTDATKEHFIDKIASLAPSELLEKDIELVAELGKKGGVAFRQPEAFVEKSAQLLWSVAV
jgi:type I site-specific restriction endonuclease